MKKLMMVAVLGVALAGCDNAAEEAEDTAVVEEVADTSAGTYEVTAADGATFTAVLNADGTYQDTDAAGTVTESGTWEDRPDGTTCFDPEGEDDGVVCFTVSEPAEDGSMIATPDDGSEPLTIRKTA